MPSRILVVDDEPATLRAVSRTLSGQGYEVQEASSPDAALEQLRSAPPDLVLTDLAMPKMSGVELLQAVHASFQDLPVIVMSGAGTVEDAVQAVKMGAVDFLEKPMQRERLRVTLEHALRYSRLHEAQARARDDLGEQLVGSSAPMRQLLQLVDKVAKTDAKVLVRGENGTGKELVANAIHAASKRKDEPFVKLNCSAVPRELIESELFGHEKGAFTGAHSTRRGRFELAHSGTLFLDEVGDMPLQMQVKLLRVLQEGQFERVGGTRTFNVDVRVITATNRDLETMVDGGKFREDLFYRLNVVAVTVPPLRERLEDLPELLEKFSQDMAVRGGRPQLRFSDAAIDVLKSHTYPGNVRELRNLVERLSILTEAQQVEADEVQSILSAGKLRRSAESNGLYKPGRSLGEMMSDAERMILRQAIEAHDSNKSAAAKALSVERSHFYKKCRSLGL